ncbi:MAG: DUF1289 domain-containing protein [Lysobacterales bacterium]
MSFFIGSLNRPISTPCIGVCELDADGLCLGCRRSGNEIAGWGSLSETERLRMIAETLPQRAVRSGG